MLSTKDYNNQGKIIATIMKGGKKTNQALYIYDKELKDLKNKPDSSKLLKYANPNSKKGNIKKDKYKYLKKKIEEDDDDISESDEETKSEMKNIKNKISDLSLLEFNLDDDDSKLVPTPNIDVERDVFFIGGASGSGKSYISSLIAQNYHTLFPDNEIYLFSRVLEDEAFDRLGYINRIEINAELVEQYQEDPDFYAQFENSLVIFDDIDVLPVIHETVQDQNGKIKSIKIDLSDHIRRIRDFMMSVGRHHSISMMSMVHQLLNYKQTRASILESNFIIFFKNSGDYFVTQLLKKYVGLGPKMIKKILELPSRWCLIAKNNYPKYALYESGAFILDERIL